jgi:cytidylate kinase
MIRAITIAREYGGGGSSVGRLLADRLGWRLLDRDLLNEVARAANVAPAVAERFDERIDPWFHRLVKNALWRGAPDAPISVGQFDLFDAETMAVVGRKVIEEAARMGNCVVVGRGGQCILHRCPDVFHVFLYAPIEIRKKRVAERLRAGPRGSSDLETVIREYDRLRAAGVRQYFDQQWCNPNLYDLMINTKRGYESAMETILCAADVKAEVTAH